MRTRLLDVSELPPPEPLQRAFDALRGMAAGDHLVLVHRRQPIPLYAMLAELGFDHRVCARGDRFEITIWRRCDAPPIAGP